MRRAKQKLLFVRGMHMNSRNKTTAEQPGNADILAQLFEEQSRTEHYITAVSNILDRYEKMYESANRDIDSANPQIYRAGSYEDFCGFLGAARRRNARLLAEIGALIKGLNDQEKAE